MQKASVECLLEYDVIRVWALKPARSGFKSRLCHLLGAVPLAEFKFLYVLVSTSTKEDISTYLIGLL